MTCITVALKCPRAASPAYTFDTPFPASSKVRRGHCDARLSVLDPQKEGKTSSNLNPTSGCRTPSPQLRTAGSCSSWQLRTAGSCGQPAAEDRRQLRTTGSWQLRLVSSHVHSRGLSFRGPGRQFPSQLQYILQPQRFRSTTSALSAASYSHHYTPCPFSQHSVHILSFTPCATDRLTLLLPRLGIYCIAAQRLHSGQMRRSVTVVFTAGHLSSL